MVSKDATLQRDPSTNPEATDFVCMCVKLIKCCVVCVYVLHRGQYGEVCVFSSTLCTYDMRKGDLYLLNRARVRRVCLGVYPENKGKLCYISVPYIANF